MKIDMSHQIAAQRITSNEPVGDGWIYGRLARELVAAGLVTNARLQAYRNDFERAVRRQYKTSEAGEILIARLRARHDHDKHENLRD